MSTYVHRRAAPAEVHVDNDGVRMRVSREMRLRHASDTVIETGVVFGGDNMGHWNVDRINRLLDAFDAPVRQFSLPRDVMRAMAKVGAPDMQRVGRYAQMGVASMPPLTFVSLEQVTANAEPTNRTLMVDGHHRLMALAIIGVTAVPARFLPRALVHDVRVIEVVDAAIFPEPRLDGQEVEFGRWQA